MSELLEEYQMRFTTYIDPQMLSVVIHLDNMTRTVGLLKRPDGSKQFPARSCCDLKEQYSKSQSGGCTSNSFSDFEFFLND